MKETIEINNNDSLILKFLYNTCIGKLILLFVTRVSFSKIVTKFLNSRSSSILIKQFVKKYNIDQELFEDRKYKSFNDYFKRNKKEEYINIDREPNNFICPCDCKLSVYKAKEQKFRIKHVDYDLESLLKSKAFADEYSDGYVMICRLTPDDYHRYCYIDDGYHDANKKIKGLLHTVRPIAICKKDVFVTNSRSYTVLDTVNFGQVIQIEVGALMVGKIKNNYTNYSFKKGEEKGFFEYGGSTIILLVKKDNVKIDNYLINNTKNGYETKINMGDKIGVKVEKED